MENFHSLGLHDVLTQSLLAMQFEKPTPIQAQTIPHALEGKDVLGSAQTGTGKTVAYGIPLVSHLLNNDHGSAIVLVPTRELATQVLAQLHQLLGKKSHIRSTLLIGGDSMFKQLGQLKTRPRLIVGTPGRINDHLDRGTLKLHNAGFLVFDETDRMLDMGFSTQIQQIVKHMPEKRQTLMFSATMAPSIIKIAHSHLKDAVRVSVGSTTAPMDKIKQELIKTNDSEKYTILLAHLEKLEGSFIVFMKTKHATERLALKLRGNGHAADAIHGDLRQKNREQVIRRFREGKHRILVATDVAARGLDIPHIECVVNYDLPMNPEDYIHRIGRTGRAGKEGFAISMVTPQDGTKWRAIHKLINDGEHTAPEAYKRSSGSNNSAPRSNNSRSNDSRGGFSGARRSDDRKKDFGRSAAGNGGFKKREFGENSHPFEGEFKKKSFGGNPFGGGARFEGDRNRSDRPAGAFEGGFKKKSFGDNSNRFEGDRNRSDRPAGAFEGGFKKKSFGGNAGGFDGNRSRDDRPRGDRREDAGKRFESAPRGGQKFSKPGERDNRGDRSNDRRPDAARKDSRGAGFGASKRSAPRSPRVA